MNDRKFEQRYLGKFPEDVILKALEKSYIAVADKDRNLFLPQAIIKNGIDAIKYGAKPEEALFGVLESMGTLIKELHKQAITRAQCEVKPILVMNRDDNE